MSKIGWERIWICFLVFGVVVLAATWLVMQDETLKPSGTPAVPREGASEIDETGLHSTHEEGAQIVRGESEAVKAKRNWRAEMMNLRETPGLAYPVGEEAAKTDFSNAMVLINEIASEADGAVLLMVEECFSAGFLLEWIGMDPRGAYRWNGYGKLRSYQERALKAWARVDPLGALAELDARGTMRPAYGRDVRVVIAAWVMVDPVAAIALCKTRGFRLDARLVNGALATLLDDGAYTAAARLLAENQLEVRFTGSVGMIAGRWVTQDYEATMAWIDGLPPVARERAVERLIDWYRALPGGLGEAMALAESTWSDGEISKNGASAIVRGLLKMNPKQLVSWVDEHVSMKSLPAVLDSVLQSTWLINSYRSGTSNPVIVKLLTDVEGLPREKRLAWVAAISKVAPALGFPVLLASLDKIPEEIRGELEQQLAEEVKPKREMLDEMMATFSDPVAQDMLVARNLDALAPRVEDARALFDSLNNSEAKACALYKSSTLLKRIEGVQEVIGAFDDPALRDVLWGRHARLVKTTAEAQYLFQLAEQVVDSTKASDIAEMAIQRLGDGEYEGAKQWMLENLDRVPPRHASELGARMSMDELLLAVDRPSEQLTGALVKGWVSRQSVEQLQDHIGHIDGELGEQIREHGAGVALRNGAVEVAVDFVRSHPDSESVAWRMLDEFSYSASIDDQLSFVSALDLQHVPRAALDNYRGWSRVERLSAADECLERNPGLATPSVLALLYGARAFLRQPSAERWAKHHEIAETEVIRDLRLRAAARDGETHPAVVATFAEIDAPSDELVASVAKGFAKLDDAVDWIDSLGGQHKKDIAWASVAPLFPGEDAVLAALNITDSAVRGKALAVLSNRVRKWGFEADEKLGGLPLSAAETRVLKRSWIPDPSSSTGHLLDEW